jgi:hypothetical protein
VSFTLFTAAAGGVRVALENCRIWANGIDDYGRCRGGTNDGHPCLHVCDGNAAVSCASDEDCVKQSAGATCSNLTDCKTAPSPGTCDAPAGVPAGAGSIDLVDFAPATDAVIEHVVVYDHRRGSLAFAVGAGTGARIRWSDNTLQSRRGWPGSFIAPPIPQPAWTVTTAASLGGGTVEANTLRAVTTGISATGASVTIARNDITVLDTAGPSHGVFSDGAANRIEGNHIVASPTASGAVGVWIEGSQQQIVANFIAAFTGIRGAVTTASNNGGSNVSVIANRLVGGRGPKIVAQGAGWQISSNYLAWGTSGRGIIELGSDDALAVYVDHLIVADNTLHSNLAGSAGIRFMDVGKRCNRGERQGRTCTADGPDPSAGCPRATCPGCCVHAYHQGVLVSGNQFLSMDVGVDAAPLVSGDTSVHGLTLVGNAFGGFVGTAVQLPAAASHVEKTVIASNNFEAMTGAPIAGWSWSMGTLLDNAGLAPSDDALHIVRLTNATGGALVAGDAVEIATTADNAVTQAPRGSTKPIGIALTGAADGAVEKVALRGTTSCNTTDVAIARGDRLKVSTKAGKLAPGRSQDAVFAVALSGRSAGDGTRSVRCLLLP